MTRRNILLILISLLMALNTVPFIPNLFADDSELGSEQTGTLEPEASVITTPAEEATPLPTPEDQGDPGGVGVTETEADDATVDEESPIAIEPEDPLDEDVAGFVSDGDDNQAIETQEPEDALTEDFVDASEADDSYLPIMPTDDSVTVTYYVNGAVFATRPTDSSDHAIYLTVFSGQYPPGATLFRGWYTSATGNVQFDFTQTVTTDISLYAQFDMSYLIKYKSASGGVGDEYVIDTKVLNQGQPIPETTEADKLVPPPNMPNGHIAHWYIEGEDMNTPFIFGYTYATQDLVLVPFWSNLHWVYFESDGSPVPPQLVAHGSTATIPSPPTRDGYDFAGWTLTPTNGPDFNFSGTAIMQDIVLYSKWTPRTVNYTVVIWMEKPNLDLGPGQTNPGTDQDHYMFTQAVTRTATAGSTVNYATEASVIINLGFAPNLLYCQFHHGDTKAIAGTGLTIVNVYYSRIVYNFVFDLVPDDFPNARRSGSVLNFNGQTYTQGWNVDTNQAYPTRQYSFQAKFEQDIESIWPSVWNATGFNRFRTSTDGGSTWGPVTERSFASWYSQGMSMNLASKRFTVTADLIPSSGTTRTFEAVYMAIYENVAEYWLEALPGETGTPMTFNGQTRYYVRSTVHSQTIFISTTLSPKNIEGVVHAGSVYLDRNGNIVTYESTNVYTNRFYYNRNVFDFSFNLQGGTWPAGSLRTDVDYTRVMFDARLSYYTPNNNPVRANHVFLYWSYDVDGYDPIDLSTARMPNNNLQIFAQWQKSDLTLTYWDNRYSNPQIVDVQPIGEGDVINFANAPFYVGQVVPGFGTFEGWYVNINNVWAKWPPDRRVTGNVDLHAGWITDGFTVTYNLGSGSGTLPIDTNIYWSGRQIRLSYGNGVIPPANMVLVGWRPYYDGISASEANRVLIPSNYYPIYGNTTLTAVYANETDAVHMIYHSNYPDNTPNTTLSMWVLPVGGNITLLDGSAFTSATAQIQNWNTLANGSGTSYSLGGTMPAPPPMTTVDLYAQWASLTDYTVNYLLENTTIALHDPKYVSNQISGTPVTEYAEDIYGYELSPLSRSPITITLQNQGNVINFYYRPIQGIRVTFDKNTTDPVIGPTPAYIEVTFNAPYGTLATIYRDNYAFTGWYTEPVGGSLVTSSTVVTRAESHTLYAHWQEVPAITNFAKTATTSTYIPGELGQTLTYNFTFTMPSDVSDFGALRVEDRYPANGMSFTNATIQIGGGTSTALSPDSSTASGIVSFSFNASALSSMAGQNITITMNFNVLTSATGTLTDRGNYYVTPRGGQEPANPTGGDDESVYARDFSVTYNANGATGGSVPTDPNSPYVANATVTVLANTGDLVRTDYTFVGWARTNNALTPEFAVSGSTVTPANFTINSNTVLYAVWLPVPGLIDFAKTATTGTYIPGEPNQTLNYTFSFRLPADISGYQALRIDDIYPASAMSFTNATIKVGNGTAVAINPSGNANGELSFVFNEAALASMTGNEVVISMNFSVSTSATGVLVNQGNYYITPKGGQEPTTPTGGDDAEVLPREFSVTYNANGATGGSVPIDTNSPYVANATVNVLANTGGLYRDNYAFVGWARDANALAPEFTVNNANVTPATFAITASTTLYAVWSGLPPITNFTKTATTETYIPNVSGQTLTYTFTFNVPNDVSGYDRLRIEDRFQANEMSFANATIQVGGGTATTLTPDSSTTPGVVSFSFNAAALVPIAGQSITITMNFNVSTSATGVLTDQGNYYITPKGGQEPSTPTGGDDAEVYPRDFSVTYNANGATGGSVPIDTNSPYVANATVTVLANTGNLVRTNYTFLGWARDANATVPEFAVDNANVTPATFNITANTTLYAVWQLVGDLPDFTKTATTETYIPGVSGQTLTYTFTFTMFSDVSGCDKLRVEDRFQANEMSFANATIQVGGGTATTLTPDSSTTSGVVSFSFNAAALAPMAGQSITITMNFNVSTSA
ncbi:MAG: InlB B-repeat-containing protein, partial [Coriobacteriia bacterium]|nr:InlB B-repeat-containing protein [Coriobacteriia bacterium]